MATVLLGNRFPREVPAGTQVHVNGKRVSGEEGEPVEGKTIVVIETPTHDSEGKKIGIGKRLIEVHNAFNLHSTTGEAEWVESHDERFAEAVAEEYECPVGRPDDWDENPSREEEDSREEDVIHASK